MDETKEKPTTGRDERGRFTNDYAGPPDPVANGKKGGRPSTDMRDKFREHGDAALDVIVELAQSADHDAVRLAAAKELLDRGYGKVKESVAVTSGGK